MVFSWCRTAAIVCFVVASGSSVFATPDLKFVSGSDSVTIAGTGSSVWYFNPSFDGWNIQIVFGSSNSPNLQGPNGAFGLDITSMTATCLGGPCSSDPLDIYLSDTGFTAATPDFTNAYSTTGAVGSTSQTAWFDTTNTMFGEGTLIGTVGPLTGTAAGSVASAGYSGPGPYSLTLEDVFTAGPSGVGSFSSDGNISAPEPVSAILLGSLFLLIGFGLRRIRGT